MIAEQTLILNWLAFCFVALFCGIWSGQNVKYGYVLVPLITGFFLMIGWISTSTAVMAIPIMFFIGVISFLRSHARDNYGVGSAGKPLLYQIFWFLVCIQIAVIIVNGMGIFQTHLMEDSQIDPKLQTYTVDRIDADFGASTKDLSTADQSWVGFGLIWQSWNLFWSTIWGFFTMYGTMVDVFKVPALVAAAVSAGVYLMTAFEVFVLIFRPYRAPEL